MANLWKVLGAMAALWAALATLAWAQGGFYFAKHETDMLHLIDVVSRRSLGDLPHVDFMTPLGLWAFEPFVLLHRAGLGLGHALAMGQVLLAALVLAPAWYVAVTRFDTTRALVFGAGVLLLICGLVYGGTDPKISLSMHYNRWAWALVALPLVIAALPRQRGCPWVDGAVTGLVMAALAMMKITYFVGFAPAVIVGLVLRRDWRALGMALAVGLVILLALTAVYGVGYWQDYFNDTLTVARSEVRAAPGDTLSQVLLSSKFLAATAVAVWTLLALRLKARGAAIGLVMALIFAGGVYVTWQNFGNDPLWLLLWGLLLLSLPQDARGWRKAPLAGALSLALIAPVALNIAWSPVRAATLPKAPFAALFPAMPQRDDIFGVNARLVETAGRLPLYGTEGMPACTLTSGLVAWMRGIAAEMEEAQLGGSSVYVADLFNFLWLFGDFERLEHGAPWYYAGLPGFEDAELLVVPACPIDPGVSKRVQDEIDAGNIVLVEDFRSNRMTVYQIER